MSGQTRDCGESKAGCRASCSGGRSRWHVRRQQQAPKRATAAGCIKMAGSINSVANGGQVVVVVKHQCAQQSPAHVAVGRPSSCRAARYIAPPPPAVCPSASLSAPAALSSPVFDCTDIQTYRLRYNCPILFCPPMHLRHVTFHPPGAKAKGGDKGGALAAGTAESQKSDIYKLVRMIMERNYDPVIVFSFSKVRQRLRTLHTRWPLADCANNLSISCACGPHMNSCCSPSHRLATTAARGRVSGLESPLPHAPHVAIHAHHVGPYCSARWRRWPPRWPPWSSTTRRRRRWWATSTGAPWSASARWEDRADGGFRGGGGLAGGNHVDG